MIEAVGYVRVSSKKQEDEGYSIPSQIKLLKNYAEKNDIKILKMFEESSSAGKAGRKSYNEMLDFIKQHNIRNVLVEKTDRIYRNFKDYVVLEDYDLTVHLVKENVVLSKDSKSHEKLVHGFKVLLAKNYIDNLSEEVRKGLSEKVAQGYYPQKAPVGYLNVKNPDNKKKIIVPDPQKSVYIKRLFELYARGAYSVDELRIKLFDEGFNNNGRPYSKARLLYVLKDVFYIGKFTYKGIVHDGKHAAIVDVDTFNIVQKMFNQSKARTHNVEFTYQGLLTCGHCGCQMTAELKKGKYVYYHCTGKRGGTCKKDYIREEKLDEVFLELISKIPHPGDSVFKYLKQAVLEIRKMKTDYEEISAEDIQNRVSMLQKRLDNLYADKLDGRITQEFWEEKHNLWYREKEHLLRKLIQINNAGKTLDEGSNLLENFCKYAQQEYLRADVKKKQSILRLLGSNFSYKDGKVSVELTSVFDFIINNGFGNYGAGKVPMSELYKKYNFENLITDELIKRLKLFDFAA